ncbi:MAG: hypothetical protein XXXJIFNMEKO3_LKCDNKCA_00133 (plasmid) [Candidatus Erwinia impunctatus]
MSRERNSIISNGLFSCLVSTIFEIGSASAAINQRVHTAFIGQFAIAIKRITGDAHDFTGFRDVVVA